MKMNWKFKNVIILNIHDYIHGTFRRFYKLLEKIIFLERLTYKIKLFLYIPATHENKIKILFTQT